MTVLRKCARASAVALCLFETSLAQTIRDGGGSLVDANETTVAPAAESVPLPDTGATTVQLAGDARQLTDAVLANLTARELSDISLFYFSDTLSNATGPDVDSSGCKTMPGDPLYPTQEIWSVFNLLSDNALSNPAPLGAACYPSTASYNATLCQYLIENWSYSATHINHPTSVMQPLFEGSTCQPQDGNSSSCTQGAFPPVSVRAENVFQIQLAVNLARNLNLRLVVHNTGHDFLGKSTGEGALSVWTRHLTDIIVIGDYASSAPKGYRGPAMKLGAGVQVGDLYAAADKAGYTGVGGECHNVGVTGGYSAGGGHSPVSSMFGLASDQVLSIDVVTPNGRFITVDETHHPDLYWAMRGGGAATWGVVVSMTVKVHPKMSFVGVTWDVASTGPDGLDITEDQFFQALRAYWAKFAGYLEQGPMYGYSWVFPAGDGTYSWSMNPWMVPEMALDDFKAMVQPLLDEWKEMGVDPSPEFFEHDNFYDAWTRHFPTENVGHDTSRSGSRFIPKSTWDNETLLEDTLDVLQSLGMDDASLIMYNMNPARPADAPDSAANPAWRDAAMFVISGVTWAENATEAQVSEANRKLTYDNVNRLKSVTPGGGGYMNEGDVMDPIFQQTFWGEENYERLYKLKKEVDPNGVFYAPSAVGSEDWYITGQDKYITMQTGTLCRVGS